jgi:3-oxoacyl-[acyl-carrier-protein] synthase II
MKKRVVITGLGLVTPVGIGVEQTWEALCAGKFQPPGFYA